MYYVTGVVCQIKLGHVVEETDSGKTTAHSKTHHTTSTAVSTSKQPHEEEGENYIQHTSLKNYTHPHTNTSIQLHILTY